MEVTQRCNGHVNIYIFRKHEGDKNTNDVRSHCKNPKESRTKTRELEIGGKIETSRPQLRSARILRRTEKIYCRLRSSPKIKREFFQTVAVSVQLYGCTTNETLTKKKKLDGDYTKMLHAVLDQSWKQHSTKQQLFDDLPPISHIIQLKRTRHAGHYRRCKDKLIIDYYSCINKCWSTSKNLHSSA